MTGRSKTLDAVVVGSGISGLATASLLVDQGLTIRVLEASPQIGGRIKTIHDRHLDEPINLGGEFVGSHHSTVRRWCRSSGIKLRRRDGFSATGVLPRKVYVNGSFIAKRDLDSLEQELNCLMNSIVLAARAIDPIRPWNSGHDEASFNQISVDQWITRGGYSETLRSLFSDLATNSQSMLGLLSLVAGAGGMPFFSDTETYCFRDGAGSLVKALADHVRELITLNTPICRIAKSREGVTLYSQHSSGRREFTAKAVVFAVPPSCLRRIDGMPGAVLRAAPRMSQNRRVSLIVDFGGSEHRLREINVLTDGACRLIWGGPRKNQRIGKVELLVCPYRSNTRLSMRHLVRRALELVQLSEASLLEVHELRWDRSPWSRGVYPVFGLGQLTSSYDCVLDGVAPIFFVGDHVIPGFAGYIEGALRSSERTAACIVNGLQ